MDTQLSYLEHILKMEVYIQSQGKVVFIDYHLTETCQVGWRLQKNTFQAASAHIFYSSTPLIRIDEKVHLLLWGKLSRSNRTHSTRFEKTVGAKFLIYKLKPITRFTPKGFQSDLRTDPSKPQINPTTHPDKDKNAPSPDMRLERACMLIYPSPIACCWTTHNSSRQATDI